MTHSCSSSLCPRGVAVVHLRAPVFLSSCDVEKHLSTGHVTRSTPNRIIRDVYSSSRLLLRDSSWWAVSVIPGHLTNAAFSDKPYFIFHHQKQSRQMICFHFKQIFAVFRIFSLSQSDPIWSWLIWNLIPRIQVPSQVTSDPDRLIKTECKLCLKTSHYWIKACLFKDLIINVILISETRLVVSNFKVLRTTRGAIPQATLMANILNGLRALFDHMTGEEYWKCQFQTSGPWTRNMKEKLVLMEYLWLRPLMMSTDVAATHIHDHMMLK